MHHAYSSHKSFWTLRHSSQLSTILTLAFPGLQLGLECKEVQFQYFRITLSSINIINLVCYYCKYCAMMQMCQRMSSYRMCSTYDRSLYIQVAKYRNLLILPFYNMERNFKFICFDCSLCATPSKFFTCLFCLFYRKMHKE